MLQDLLWVYLCIDSCLFLRENDHESIEIFNLYLTLQITEVILIPCIFCFFNYLKKYQDPKVQYDSQKCSFLNQCYPNSSIENLNPGHIFCNRCMEIRYILFFRLILNQYFHLIHTK